MAEGNDSFVQVPPQSTGLKVATTEVTRDDGVTVVERQEVVLSDPYSSDSKAAVRATDKLEKELKIFDSENSELLFAILMELRSIKNILLGGNVTELETSG